MLPVNQQSIVLPVHQPFDFDQCLVFLRRSTQEVMHVVTEDAVLKLFDINSRLVLGKVKQHATGLAITFPYDAVSSEECAYVEKYVREWFDLDQDITAFERLAEQDTILRPLVEAYRGLRVIGFPDLFEALTWAVLGQQITLSFAYTLKRRFVEQYGRSREVEGVTYWTFPHPNQIIHVKPEQLRELQFSTRKAEYIIGIARQMVEGDLSKEALQAQSSHEIRETLLLIRGVGEWTADYVRMKCFQDPSAFPVADAGLQQALKYHLGRQTKLTREEVLRYGEAWKGWESYATFYLWRSLYGNV